MYAYLWVISTSSRPLSGGCWKAFWVTQGITDERGSRQESGHTNLMTKALHITDRWYNSVRVGEQGCFLNFQRRIRQSGLLFWVIFTSEFSVLKDSALDDSKWQPLVGWWVFFISLVVAEPGVFVASTVEEVDRLQLHHPSWLLYESAMMNLIGGGLA